MHLQHKRKTYCRNNAMLFSQLIGQLNNLLYKALDQISVKYYNYSETICTVIMTKLLKKRNRQYRNDSVEKSMNNNNNKM